MQEVSLVFRLVMLALIHLVYYYYPPPFLPTVTPAISPPMPDLIRRPVRRRHLLSGHFRQRPSTLPLPVCVAGSRLVAGGASLLSGTGRVRLSPSVMLTSRRLGNSAANNLSPPPGRSLRRRRGDSGGTVRFQSTHSD